MQPNCTARSLMVNSFCFPNRHSIVLKAWMYCFLVIPERRIATFYKEEKKMIFMYFLLTLLMYGTLQTTMITGCVLGCCPQIRAAFIRNNATLNQSTKTVQLKGAVSPRLSATSKSKGVVINWNPLMVA